jgi:mRNA-degrading endonuclease toxin of MazEF toxin-antitoxin module
MAANIRQGDIIEVAGIDFVPLVINNNERSMTDTKVMVCPIIQEETNNKKHIYVEGEHIKGYACCDQVRRINLLAKQYKAIDHISYEQIAEVSSTINSSMNFI